MHLRSSIPAALLAIATFAPQLSAQLASQSRTWTYGHAKAGGDDDQPAITSHGGLPDLGNAAFEVGMQRGLGGSGAVLVTGLRPGALTAPWGSIWVDTLPPAIFASQLTVLQGTPGQPGAGWQRLPLPIPSTPALAGTHLSFQWFSFDVGVAGKIVHTDGLGICLGDPATSAQCTGSLAYGDHVVCSVATGGFSMFSFQGSAGDVVFLRAVAAGFQSAIQVYEPGGTLLRNVDPGCTDLNEITATLPASGTYTILVRDGSCSGPAQQGTFGLSLHKVNAAAADELPIGCVLQSRIDGRGHVSAHTFAATAGDSFFLRTTAAGHQPRVMVFDPAGARTTFDAGCTDLLERRAIQAAETGTYTLLVMDGTCSGSGQAGPCSLFLQRTNAPASATSFPMGRTLSADLTSAGDADSYTVELAAGDVLFARLTTAGHQPRLSLFDPSGVQVGDVQPGCTDEAELTTAAAPVAGVYTIVVRDGTCSGSRQSGAYALYLQNLNHPVVRQVLPHNTTQAVDVARAGAVAPLLIQVPAASTLLTVTLTTSALQPAFTLHDAAGNLLAVGDPGCAGQSTLTLANVAAGDYLLQLTDGSCSGSRQRGTVMASLVLLP